jgi:drug/metabolite transporter (DMT)-like permease
LLPRRGWRIGYTGRPGLHLLRGLLLVGSSLAAFTALQHIPVAEFTAIVALSPLVVTVLAALIFRERVSLLRWLLVLGGFAGALIIIRPGAESFSAMMLLPLLVLAANSSFQLLTSHMVRTEDPMTMHLYTGWIGALISALALPWAWAQLSGLEWARMMVMGLSAAIGHFLLILAYSRTPVAVMAPYLYAQIAFAVIGGWLVFSHTPDGWALTGMCVIGTCGATGAWLILRQSRSDRAAQVLAQDAR